MMLTIPRAAFGVFALLFTVATVDVSRAMAQTTLTPTACGVGAIAACGTEEIKKCETTFSFNFNVLLQSGGVTWSTTNCTSAGYKTLYKDMRTISTSTDGTSNSCGGSTGTGLSGMRGSGDEEETFELCEM
ncbi:hypothetical protein [Gemmatimonas sp.]|uniref:hypothetical protein n=1 Tax=Gemmatimonas sp. TaxID=1962908 RepID=UPI00398315ED